MTSEEFETCIADFCVKNNISCYGRYDIVRNEVDVTFIKNGVDVNKSLGIEKIRFASVDTLSSWLDQWIRSRFEKKETKELETPPSPEEYRETITAIWDNWQKEKEKSKIQLYDQVIINNDDKNVGIVIDITKRNTPAVLVSYDCLICTSDELTKTGKNFRKEFEKMLEH